MVVAVSPEVEASTEAEGSEEAALEEADTVAEVAGKSN